MPACLQGCVLANAVAVAWGHGSVTYPPNRHGGTLSHAGLMSPAQLGHNGSGNGGLYWFSQPMVNPAEDEPLLNDEKYRTYNVKTSAGEDDWTRRMPWRSPGKAPVRGSGCGVAGGGPVPCPNGGFAPPEYPMGMDGYKLPETSPVEWKLGSVVEMAWAMLANHGGGYSWRVCKKTEAINEECFQRNSLPFHGNSSWIQYGSIINRTFNGYLKLPRFEIPRVDVPHDMVYPKGSHWARNPIPSCLYCNQAKCGNLLPNLSLPITNAPDVPPNNFGGDEWWKVEKCAQECSGFNLPQCPPGMTQFPEPLSGLSGYLGPGFEFADFLPGTVPIEGFNYNIVDKVEIPDHLEPGDYVLSWRWDCEQSPQIWQNCADIRLTRPSMYV